MLKTRIILVVVTLVLVSLIFLLPKVVVDNDSDLSSDVAQGQEEHSGTISPETASNVQELLKDFTVSEDNEKSAIFADSLAVLYDELGLLDSAASFREQASQLVPGKERLLETGEAYYKAYSFSTDPEKIEMYGQKAREFFEKVLEQDPDNLDVKAKIAMTYVSGPTPMQGIMILREIIEKDPENKVALFNLGILSIQSGQYDKAVERLEKLVKIDPENVQAHYFLGVSYYETDQIEKSKNVLNKLLAMNPDETVRASVDSYLEMMEEKN